MILYQVVSDHHFFFVQYPLILPFMKKCVFVSFVIFFFSISLSAQTVDSIKVEQAGDKILIHYQILQSNELQVFRVTLSCFLSTGIKLEPKSISGDFGENVVGGKPDYMIVWDVLKDLEELQSAEFSVKAELVKGSLTNSAKKGRAKNKFYVQVIGEGSTLPGLRIGYSGAWGISLRYSGVMNKKINQYVDHQSTDITKRIFNIKNSQMHLFMGLSFAQLRIRDMYPEDDVFSFLGPDFGLLMNIRKFSMSFQCAYFGDQGKVPDGAYIDHFRAGLGLGIRF